MGMKMKALSSIVGIYGLLAVSVLKVIGSCHFSASSKWRGLL
jgi:hypothetical protein